MTGDNFWPVKRCQIVATTQTNSNTLIYNTNRWKQIWRIDSIYCKKYVWKGFTIEEGLI